MKLEDCDIGDLIAELRRRGWRALPTEMADMIHALSGGLVTGFFPHAGDVK